MNMPNWYRATIGHLAALCLQGVVATHAWADDSLSRIPVIQIAETERAEPLPAAVTITFRPVAPVPFEIEVETPDGEQLKIEGYASHDAAGQGLVRQRFKMSEMHWRSKNLTFSVPMSGGWDYVLDSTGKIWSLSRFELGLPDEPPSKKIRSKEWRDLVDELTESVASPGYAIAYCAASVTAFPDRKVTSNQKMGPQRWPQLLDRMAECVVAAVRGGMAPPSFGTRNEYLTATGTGLEDLIRQHRAFIEETVGQSGNYTSDVRVAGIVRDMGNEFLLISGTAVAEIEAEPKTTDRFSVLIDPYTGIPYKAEISSTLGKETWRKTYRIDIPSAVPDFVTAGIQRPSPSESGEGTIAGVYDGSVRAIFDIVAADSRGTGFAISDRRILTAAHVVGGQKRVRAISIDGREIPCRVVASHSKRDVAVLEISEGRLEHFLRLAQDIPTTGSQVIVIGSPGGLSGTLTTGIVSSIRMLDGVKLIQVDALINHGNSGGPILDLRGEVIGIVSFEFVPDAEAKGLGFGVSALEARSALP